MVQLTLVIHHLQPPVEEQVQSQYPLCNYQTILPIPPSSFFLSIQTFNMRFLSIVSVFLAATPLALAKPTKPSKPNCPPRKVSQHEKKQIWEDFVKTFWVDKTPTVAFANHIDENYIQHNPGALSGRQAAIDTFANMNMASLTYTILNKGFDGNTGWIHTKMEIAGVPQPYAVVDVLRFEGSCIMEHWDVAQMRPANSINPIAMW